MNSITRNEAPVAIEGDGVELRSERIGGGMSATFVHLPAGADLRAATKGLPGDLCQCPHWGYMLSGRVRMHTEEGHQDFSAGDSFYCCLLYTSPSPRDGLLSRMPSSA